MGKKILYAFVAILIVIQVVPVERSNPAEQGRLAPPPEVQAVLQKACYDCHSHQTRWPWYAYVAPVSWLVAHDVEEAREHLNFSAWEQYPEKRQMHKLEEIWEEVEEGEMPLWFYVPLHSEAKLSDQDCQILRDWVHATVPADSISDDAGQEEGYEQEESYD